jgi:hypothetical protein
MVTRKNPATLYVRRRNMPGVKCGRTNLTWQLLSLGLSSNYWKIKKIEMRICRGAGGDWVEPTGSWEVSEWLSIYLDLHLNDSIADRREEAFKHFIASLKHTSSFAPAFTSLGIYYSEAENPI